MDNVFFDGDIFGIVDNGVLAVLAILGIDIDKKTRWFWCYGRIIWSTSW